jgi:hypothetical protein
MNLGGRRSGAIPGTVNMAGNLASFVSANALALLSGRSGCASAYFFAAALPNFTGAWCWVRMGSVPEAA